MTEIFKLTSLARDLLPIDDDLLHTSTFREVKIQRQKDQLSIFWEDVLIVKSTNYLVEHFDGEHLDEATQALTAVAIGG